MCGLAGFIDPGRQPHANWRACLDAMGTALRHRGPDDAGAWQDPEAGVGLVHRRLSVLDLSPAGHQPMTSTSGRYVIVFNGEIYNHLELRAVLGPRVWRGHSDTETLLAAIEGWGIETTLKKTVGMFAIALWDRAERTLALARDRFGEKPLYYGWQGGVFLFASELKALRPHPAFRGGIDRDAVALLLRHGYVPAPYSIHASIRKLLPGTWLKVRAGAPDLPQPVPYWSLAGSVAAGTAEPFAGTEAEAVDAMEMRLREAVALQMVADVPLGAFLSGGVDSSLVVALMQAHSSRPVRTFTIGFHEAQFNEAESAKAVAQHLRTDHTELYVTGQQALDVIPRLPELYDEPFSDSSQIPTHLVAQLARRDVTVSLSGDGGDETFGGYTRYFVLRRLWRRIGWLPAGLRHGLARMLDATPTAVLHAVAAVPGLRVREPAEKLRKVVEVLSVPDADTIYQRLVSHWKQPAQVVLGATEPSNVLSELEASCKFASTEERMMFLDTLSYLSDDVLVKVDRAAMAVSLETRVPLLDHRVVELAWRLPLAQKIRGHQSKWILRQVLYKYVPAALIERPKMGFGVPIDGWLRGPLRDWAEDLLDESRLRQEGFFDPAPIRLKWLEHLDGKRDWQYYLWDILMFQAWHQRYH